MSQSLARALQVLGALDDRPRGLDDLAQLIGVHKTTVLRLLRTLQAERFVRRDDRHQYSLGSRLFELGSAALSQQHIREVAWPHLRVLAESTGGQAVHLAAPEDDRAVYVTQIEATSAVRLHSAPGMPAPLHATAVGKVLAAGLAPAVLDRVITATGLPRFTARTITDPDAYRLHLDTVRRQGWAADHGEHEDFINCIAAPIRDQAGHIIAAVSVCAPELILTWGQIHALLPQLLAATADIRADQAAEPPRKGTP